MANLLETIQKNLKPEKPVTQQLGQTEQVQSLLRAKTGKAQQPESGPRASALGERIAAKQTELGGEQIAQQQQITGLQQEEQLADIKQREDIRQQAFEQQQDLAKQQFDQQTEQLLNQYTRGEKKLTTQQDLANMEQIGFNLRLDNEQYINNLQQEGTKARLDDKTSFKEEMMREVFRDQETLLRNDLAFNNIMNIDDNAFKAEMGKMNANHARQIATDAAKAASARDKIAAGTEAATSVAKVAIKYGPSMFDNSGDVSQSEAPR